MIIDLMNDVTFSDERIIEIFWGNNRMTLSDIAVISGRTVAEIKQILKRDK